MIQNFTENSFDAIELHPDTSVLEGSEKERMSESEKEQQGAAVGRRGVVDLNFVSFPLSGNNCRGRNGCFRGRSVLTFVKPSVDETPALVRASVSSSREGSTEPIIFNLTATEAITLGELLVQQGKIAKVLDEQARGDAAAEETAEGRRAA